MQVSKPRPSINITLRNLLSGLIYCHLFILFFQIPLRELILNVTYWRDICLFLIILVWFSYSVVFFKPKFAKKISLGTIVFLFIFYGIINLFINLINSVSILDALTYFRNHFSPFFLFFPAFYVFRDEKKQKQLIFFLSIVLFVYMLTPLIELILKILNFQLSQIPWYQFTFSNSDRFEGNDIGAYINTENTPILGLLGFPHYTVVPIVGLFALIYPFTIVKRSSNLDNSRVKIVNSSIYKYLVLFLFISSILIFQVRTHIISAFLVLFLLVPKSISKRKHLFSVIVFLLLFISLFSFFNPDGIRSIAVKFIAGFIGNNNNMSSFSVLMSLNEPLFIINSNIKELFFGHGYDAVANASFTEFLEVHSTGWEVRLLYYTAVYGLFWLLLFIWLNLKALSIIRLNSKLFDNYSFQFLFSQGFKVMMIVFLIDAGHYMRMMAWPNLDTWIICLGVLAANYSSVMNSSTSN